ncbi:UNVERIFIED_CONTAM: Cationic amino acid transporter 5 [Sesamum angustifolium]|uniref:Cationic amino acid transporter 5 n=1 Tax=Sesamum angustifolium TaxID=2727405 RepID=A0AAW2PBV2_9LAMI
MKHCLNWCDLTWFGFGSVICAGIFVLTGQEAHDHAGPAIVLSHIVSGISAMLSVFCYTEFTVEIPVAGESFAYLRVELGDLATFTTGNILLESVVGSAAVARSWTSYFTTLLDRHPESLRLRTNLKDGFNLLDPIVVAVLAIASMIWRDTSNLKPFLPHGAAQGIFQAATIVYFAYGGFDSIATMAEKTRNPGRDIPLYC